MRLLIFSLILLSAFTAQACARADRSAMDGNEDMNRSAVTDEERADDEGLTIEATGTGTGTGAPNDRRTQPSDPARTAPDDMNTGTGVDTTNSNPTGY